MTGQLESLTPEPQPEAGADIESMVLVIANLFQEVFGLLVAGRDAKYAAATSPLDAAIDTLQREFAATGEAALNLEGLLESRARVSQYEADCLKLAGNSEGAEAKLQEMRQAQNAPLQMKERQANIVSRIEALDMEKKVIAKRVFNQWHGDCQAVIRTCEHGLFCVLLDGLRDSFWEFQTLTDTAPKAVGERGLFQDSHLNALTADANSPEWQTASRWYDRRGYHR